MDRRGFLGAMLAACAAPAIVRADSLMRIVPRDALIFHPDEFGLAIHGNRLLTIEQIVRESLRIAHQNMNFIGAINRGFDESFSNSDRTIAFKAANRYINDVSS